MAEVSEKPLVTVDVGQLAFEESVDSHLRSMFEQAVQWGAVLLLDEADVVLEKRSYENHARNAIVSGRYTYTLSRTTPLKRGAPKRCPPLLVFQSSRFHRV